MNNDIIFNLKTIDIMSPPAQKDPNNPFYQLDLKCSGVNSGTFGSIGTVPTLRINTKGFVTFAGATTGIVIPPVITDFTIKGQNSLLSPLYTSLENYNPDQDEIQNISGFIGNYGKSLYASSSLMYDKASGSMSVGVKSNSNNAINENNVSVGQRAMEDAYSRQCVALGSYAVSKSINDNSISIGYSVPVGGNNLPSNSNNIMLGSGIYNNSGTKSIVISNIQDLNTPGGSAQSDSVCIGGYPNLGGTPDYSGIIIGQTWSGYPSNKISNISIRMVQSILIGNPITTLITYPVNFLFKTSTVILQSDTMPYSSLQMNGLESSVYIGNDATPTSFYRDRVDGINHVILGSGAGIIKPFIVTTGKPAGCIAIGVYSTGSSNGVSIGYKSGSFLTPNNNNLPGVGSLGAAFSGGYGSGKFGVGPPESPLKVYPFGVSASIIPVADYSVGDNVSMLAGGQTHNVALVKPASNASPVELDRIYVCGDNSAGQLGLGDTTPRYTYTLISWTYPGWDLGVRIREVCAYANGTYVILTNGSLYGCGQINPATNSNTLVLIDSNATGAWTAISAARDYATGKTTWAGIKGNSLYTMGDNTFGQLGNGTTGGSTNTFALVGSSTYTKVKCGKSFIMAVRSDNRLITFGKNDVGQLGLGNTTNYNTPQVVPLFIKVILGGTPEYDTSNIVSISGGYECAVVVTSVGNAFMTGKIFPYFNSLSYTKLDIITPTGTPPYFVLPTQCLVINEYDVYFKMNNGTVYAIGRGDDGAFFAGTSPINTFTGKAQALEPARFTSLTVLGSSNTLCTGFTPGALVIMPTLAGAGAMFNRICLAADGLVIPNLFSIGGAGGKLLGNSDGTGTENFANSGSASSLPSTPAAYLSTAINGTKYKLPLYNI